MTADQLAELLTTSVVVATIVSAAFIVHLAIRLTVRLVVRRAVRRAADGLGRWQRRLPRLDDTNAELRRLQRADATAHVVSRTAGVLVAMITMLVLTHALGIDPVVLVSSAGFVGVGLAIGGQSFTKDWLTGLLVLVEDRYALGDTVVITVGGNEVTGIVERMSGFSVRLRLPDGAAWHTGHGTIESVRNEAQRPFTSTIEVGHDVWRELDETLVGRRVADASNVPGLTGVVLLPEIRTHASPAGVAIEVTANRPLDDRERSAVARHVGGGDRAA